MSYGGTTFTLGTDSSGYSYPGDSTHRDAVFDVPVMKLHKEIRDTMIFSKWIGKQSDTEKDYSPITSNFDLTKKKGDTLKFHALPKLDGDGVPGDGYMLGSEESMEIAQKTCYVNQLRHAVMDSGEASGQRGLYEIIETARPELARWWADRLEEDIIRTALYNQPPHVATTIATYGLNIESHIATPPRYWYCADSDNNSITYSSTNSVHETNIETAEGTLANTETDFMSPNVLEGMGTILRTANFMRVNFKGFSGYLCVLHPYQVAQLRKNEDWFRAYITAGPRDEKGNAIFAGVNAQGEVGCWNNFYIMESNKIPTSAHSARYSEVPINGAAEANVRRAIFMGANAMFYAEAKRPTFARELIDYGNRKGVAIVGNWGATRCDYTEDSSTATLLAQTVAVCSTYSPASTV